MTKKICQKRIKIGKSWNCRNRYTNSYCICSTAKQMKQCLYNPNRSKRFKVSVDFFIHGDNKGEVTDIIEENLDTYDLYGTYKITSFSEVSI